MSLPPPPSLLPPRPEIAPPVGELPRVALLAIMRQEHPDKIINTQTFYLDSCVMVITLLAEFYVSW